MSAIHHLTSGQYDQPEKESKGPDVQVHRQISQDSKPDQNRSNPRVETSQTLAHCIGWLTPLVIIGSFLAATLIAIIHYVYCRYLRNKPVGSTIPQSWNNALSVTFAHLFATALATSASTAFTQLLWWYLRRRSLSIATIDALFSLNCSSSNLYQLGILKTIPVLWFFGLLVPLISVATIFPPGSLVVQQLPRTYHDTQSMFTLDISNRGNGSATDFLAYALFEVGVDGEYNRPDRIFTKMARRTIREGTYDTASSSCGDNCTYELTFAAPTLRCEDDSPNLDLEQKVFNTYNNQSLEGNRPSSWDASLAQFLAAPYESNGQLKFDLSYRNEFNGTLRNISCTTMDANYTAQIQYLDSAQAVTLNITEGQPLNMSGLNQSSLFYDVMKAAPSETSIIYQTAVHNFSMPELFEIYHRTQMLAMSDLLTRSLAGAISGFGTENYFTTNTIIEDSPWASSEYDRNAGLYSDVYFDLSASRLEDLMRNITISVLNNNEEGFVDAAMAYVVYEAAYVLKSQVRLIVAYATALIVSLAFIIAGLVALFQNGTPASSGGFLQIMSTTTHGDGLMNQLAKEASLGGGNGVVKDLSDLKVRFGVVADGQSRHAAFGTVDETEVLLKGS
ncbi:hypothetical protein C7974DRAFT_17692 [Boeremia exigua]|uniref:uncharacterized protein n=1 Tax=Boeremia exigua TaxID=749465 RepID=UPI001E8D452F|nr:uncharacterized protein C7974DRAFT_17692 [Boeremia exigua]KAH6644262.1 hypothetical protein C7974DRAFT_17692 [Boeremia exigua]